MVSRRMPVSRSIRRSDHPSRPNAMTCCFFSSLKTLLTVTEDSVLTSAFNALDDGLQLAGFQVTLTGRFWVTPEVLPTGNHHFRFLFSGDVAYFNTLISKPFE